MKPAHSIELPIAVTVLHVSSWPARHVAILFLGQTLDGDSEAEDAVNRDSTGILGTRIQMLGHRQGPGSRGKA